MSCIIMLKRYSQRGKSLTKSICGVPSPLLTLRRNGGMISYFNMFVLITITVKPKIVEFIKHWKQGHIA